LSTDPLFALSPLDGRYADDMEGIRELFSESRLIRERIYVEIMYLESFLKATGKAKLWQDAYHRIWQDLSPRDLDYVKQIESHTKHDVAAVIEFIKAQMPDPVKPYVHFGLTSEDVNNLAHGLMITNSRDLFLEHLKALIEELARQAKKYRSRIMLARTHGEIATPTSMGKELALYALRFAKCYQELKDMKIEGKILGASGNLNAFVGTYPRVDWFQVMDDLVDSMGLAPNPFTVQIMVGDTYARMLDAIRRTVGILIDFDQNIWTYFMLAYLYQKADKASIGSSTMPHKINPIKFENSEGNAQIAESYLEFFSNKLVKTRLQRDLTDSTVKRNIGMAFGHGILALVYALRGVRDILVNDKKIEQDFAANGQFLSELVQLVERDKGSAEGYDHIKQQIRGKRISYKKMEGLLKDAGISQGKIDTYVKGKSAVICDKALARVKELTA